MRKFTQTALLCVALFAAGCRTLGQRGESGAGLSVRSLTCEHLVEPSGIDDAKPRLSWKVELAEAAPRGLRPAAYEVLVASSHDLLARDQGDLWSSGKVITAQTLDIRYAGSPLPPHRRAHWKVRVWDQHGDVSAWSPEASFTVGLLDPAEFAGPWVGFDAPVAEAKAKLTSEKGASRPANSPPALLLPPPRYVRGRANVAGAVSRAVLYTSALGVYEPYVNGERVGSDWFAPGWTDYTKRVYVQSHDVTGLVRPGENVLGAILGDGWYSGYVGYGLHRHHYGESPRFRAMLVVEHADGRVERFASDGAWRASTGPILESDFLMGESYDARLEQPTWAEPGFDDRGWSAVDVSASAKARVETHPGPPVRAVEELAPRTITKVGEDLYVADFGQNFAGVARLRVQGKRGQEIVLRFAERCNPDGTVYTTNLRGARTTDRYICRGDGVEIWQPRFTFHGFQYVEIRGLGLAPTRETLVGLALTSDTPAVSSFECSDPMLTQLWSNIRWTKWANFIDVPTDCPQRDERLGWTGDAQAFCRTATYLDDVQAFFDKWLVDLDDAQRADGQFPMVAPLKVAGDDGGPAWADAGVICPWTIYDAYEDRAELEKHFPAMLRFIDFCEKRSRNGVLPPEKYHCFGDWVAIGADTPHDVIYSAYFAYSTELTARAAEVLGRREDAARLRTLHGRVRAAFQSTFVGPDGVVRGDTQCGYVLALAFDLLDEPLRAKAAARLVADIEKRGGRLSTGFVGTKDLMLVLDKIGRNDVAYRLAQSTEFPSWGFSIRHGATSIWERWDGWTPERGFQDPGMNSFAHYAFGAVGQWMVEVIGGLRSLAPGFARVQIRPIPGGTLRHGGAALDTPRGLVTSSWELRDGKFILKASVPPSMTAEVWIPEASAARVLESGKAAAQSAGVRFARSVAGASVFEVESGSYLFECSYKKD